MLDIGNEKKRRVPVNWLLLDIQSTVDVVCNSRIVKNIRQYTYRESVTIHCNAGTRKVEMFTDLKNYGTVWF